MKLSDAIRLGAMLRPQTRGEILDGNGTCAMGAALEAMGALGQWAALNERDATPDEWGQFWRTVFHPSCHVTFDKYACHPVTAAVLPTICIIVSLNDEHQWTREQIAEWVATIEPQEEPCASPTSTSASLSASACTGGVAFSAIGANHED